MNFSGLNMIFSDSLFSSYLDWFHSFNCSLLLGVLIFVMMLFFFLLGSNFLFKYKKMEYQLGELLCSVFPTIILLFQMIPSLSILYFYGLMSMDSSLSLKVVGHQWYWSYDYGDVEGLEFDSYMLPVDDLLLGEKRLLDVDNRCVVPVNCDLRFCVTSSDVIHSWAIPSMCIKLDAMSGIVNVLNYTFYKVGVFYGQCSEICGVNHSFMPICLESTLLSLFKSWSLSYL
uniref:Cytochrome c oxidase subunit 2 n=1 Tax=Dictyocaulus viviparus TaxID=29172 RepID=K7QMC2_DICVI|nr:cytochrome c oxidase subunit II [Dictyocaulus viviparus]AFV32104.1 cytochrome c oxidase subunit II [Dictyocaulus viviparus]BAV82684.1 cytochrome c oxidase subunit II [Dictyocaulus viviparus]